MITQERIVVTILFIVFLIVAYRFLRFLYRKPVGEGQSPCGTGSCSSCAFNSGQSCSDKSYQAR